MKILTFTLLSISFIYGQDVFKVKHIYQYLNKNNPFYYETIAEEYIAKGRELFAQGSLDTQLNASYDNKNYPTTAGTYEGLEIFKPIENGIEFSLGYRKSKGVQEYNNIKTGKNGEIISSVKVPILSILHDISKNKVNIESARLGTEQFKYRSQEKKLKLYFNIAKIYYQLLLQKELTNKQEELLNKVERTDHFISQQIELGELPRVAKIEVEQVILSRKQQYFNEKNNFNRIRNIFLSYLGVDNNSFNRLYLLPRLKIEKDSLPNINEATQIAIENRPNLKVIDVALEKNALGKKYNNLGKYPKVDMKISTVYDPINEEGYKISFNVNFPIETRKYSGMEEILQKKNLMLHNQKLKEVMELKTDILNIYQKIETKKIMTELLEEELVLVKKLEHVEQKKLEEGVGTLVLLNQREISTLKVEQKLLKAYYELATYTLEVNYSLGKYESTEQ